jgi:hypothetical protein
VAPPPRTLETRPETVPVDAPVALVAFATLLSTTLATALATEVPGVADVRELLAPLDAAFEPGPDAAETVGGEPVPLPPAVEDDVVDVTLAVVDVLDLVGVGVTAGDVAVTLGLAVAGPLLPWPVLAVAPELTAVARVPVRTGLTRRCRPPEAGRPWVPLIDRVG